MKAIQLTETYQPTRYLDVPIPTPKPGEVRIKLRAAALNHRDVFIQKGLYPGIKLPVILGSDGAGIVDEVGEGVDAVWQGQEVIINPAMNWGNNPKFYGPDFQILGMPTNGTFAEYIVINSRYVHRKPNHLSFEQAAALPLAGLTAWRALMTRAVLHPYTGNIREKVLITGIGGGAALFALQFALAAGAEVWVTSGDDKKLEKAKQIGAMGGVNYQQPDWHKSLIDQTRNGAHPARNQSGGYFDIIIDSAGGPGFTKLIDLAAPGGRIVSFGGTAGNITDIVPPKVFFKQLSILGTTMGTESEFVDMLSTVTDQQLFPVIDSIFSINSAEEAMLKMDSGKQFGKIILSISN